MQTELRAGAVLDVLTQDELKTVLEEVASGYLRDPYRVRINAGGVTLPRFTARIPFIPIFFSSASPKT